MEPGIHQPVRANEILPPLPRLVPSAHALGYVLTPSGLETIRIEIHRDIPSDQQTTDARPRSLDPQANFAQ